MKRANENAPLTGTQYVVADDVSAAAVSTGGSGSTSSKNKAGSTIPPFIIRRRCRDGTRTGTLGVYYECWLVLPYMVLPVAT